MRSLVVTGLLSSLIVGQALIAPQAEAGPRGGDMDISMTAWEMHEGDGVLTLDEPLYRFGAMRLYPFSEIPALDDDAWQLAPSEALADLDRTSALCGTPTTCFDGADFTYFQTILDLPRSAAGKSITLGFDAIDDGVKVTVFNRRHPEGQSLPGGILFKKMDIQETKDLSALFVPGAENRVVVTLLDNCCGRTLLMGAQVKVDGEVVSGYFE